MIELINKYSKDLGSKIPESLLLLDKYENLFKLINQINKIQVNDKYKQYKYK